LSEIKEILDEFDDFGQLGQLLVPFDPENCMENSDSDSDSETETEIASRADRINLRLNNEKMIENEINNEKFLTYAKARSVSFARKLSQLQVSYSCDNLQSANGRIQSIINYTQFFPCRNGLPLIYIQSIS